MAFSYRAYLDGVAVWRRKPFLVAQATELLPIIDSTVQLFGHMRGFRRAKVARKK